MQTCTTIQCFCLCSNTLRRRGFQSAVTLIPLTNMTMSHARRTDDIIVTRLKIVGQSRFIHLQHIMGLLDFLEQLFVKPASNQCKTKKKSNGDVAHLCTPQGFECRFVNIALSVFSRGVVDPLQVDGLHPGRSLPLIAACNLTPSTHQHIRCILAMQPGGASKSHEQPSVCPQCPHLACK